MIPSSNIELGAVYTNDTISISLFQAQQDAFSVFEALMVWIGGGWRYSTMAKTNGYGFGDIPYLEMYCLWL